MPDDDIREGEPERKRKSAPRRDDDEDDDDDDDRPRRVKRRQVADDGGVGTVIPYRNGMALIAYYTGVFGLISCILGPLAFFGIVPLILGILGLKKAREDPEARGTAHAIVGILLGALEILVACGVSGFFVYSIVANK